MKYATCVRVFPLHILTVTFAAIVVVGTSAISVSHLNPVSSAHAQGNDVPHQAFELGPHLPGGVDSDTAGVDELRQAVRSALAELGDGMICPIVYWFATQAPSNAPELIRAATSVQPESYLDIVAAAVAALRGQRDEIVEAMVATFPDEAASIRKAAAAGTTGFCGGISPEHLPGDRLRETVRAPAETERDARGSIPVSVELPDEVPVVPVAPPPSPPSAPGDDDSVSPTRI